MDSLDVRDECNVFQYLLPGAALFPDEQWRAVEFRSIRYGVHQRPTARLRQILGGGIETPQQERPVAADGYRVLGLAVDPSGDDLGVGRVRKPRVVRHH